MGVPQERNDEPASLELLTVADASRLLRISRFTLYYWAATRRIPHFKIGKRVMFSKADLLAWLKSHRIDQVE